jgi:hypothetical protein
MAAASLMISTFEIFILSLDLAFARFVSVRLFFNFRVAQFSPANTISLSVPGPWLRKPGH